MSRNDALDKIIVFFDKPVKYGKTLFAVYRFKSAVGTVQKEG